MRLVFVTALYLIDCLSCPMQAELPDVCPNKFGRRIVLQLLHPDCTRYLPPAALQLMHPPQRTIRGATGVSVEGDEEEEEELAGAFGGGEGSDSDGDEFMQPAGTKAKGKGEKKEKGASQQQLGCTLDAVLCDQQRYISRMVHEW